MDVSCCVCCIDAFSMSLLFALTHVSYRLVRKGDFSLVSSFVGVHLLLLQLMQELLVVILLLLAVKVLRLVIVVELWLMSLFCLCSGEG